MIGMKFKFKFDDDERWSDDRIVTCECISEPFSAISTSDARTPNGNATINVSSRTNVIVQYRDFTGKLAIKEIRVCDLIPLKEDRL